MPKVVIETESEETARLIRADAEQRRIEQEGSRGERAVSGLDGLMRGVGAVFDRGAYGIAAGALALLLMAITFVSWRNLIPGYYGLAWAFGLIGPFLVIIIARSADQIPQANAQKDSGEATSAWITMIICILVNAASTISMATTSVQAEHENRTGILDQIEKLNMEFRQLSIQESQIIADHGNLNRDFELSALNAFLSTRAVNLEGTLVREGNTPLTIGDVVSDERCEIYKSLCATYKPEAQQLRGKVALAQELADARTRKADIPDEIEALEAQKPPPLGAREVAERLDVPDAAIFAVMLIFLEVLLVLSAFASSKAALKKEAAA